MTNIILAICTKILILCDICFAHIRHVESVHQTDEQEALIQIRPLLKNVLYRGYMRDDDFLLPFIKANHFDVHGAKVMILNHIKWRIDNRIDTIQEENISTERELVYTYGKDRDNRPVILVRMGLNDIRKVLVSGKEEDAERTAWKLAETLFVNAREANVSQVVAVIDMNGFSYRQHACRECIPFLKKIASTMESNYPGIAKAVFIINTPRLFEVLILPIGSWDIRRAVLTGNGHLLQRNFFKLVEEQIKNLNNLRDSSGKKINQFILIVDLAGFSLRTHACFSCVQVLTQLLLALESNYPLYTKTAYLINTPRAFTSVLQALQSILNELSQQTLVVYGLDKSEWQKELLRIIASEELPIQYGGKKKLGAL